MTGLNLLTTVREILLPHILHFQNHPKKNWKILSLLFLHTCSSIVSSIFPFTLLPIFSPILLPTYSSSTLSFHYNSYPPTYLPSYSPSYLSSCSPSLLSSHAHFLHISSLIPIFLPILPTYPPIYPTIYSPTPIFLPIIPPISLTYPPPTIFPFALPTKTVSHRY